MPAQDKDKLIGYGLVQPLRRIAGRDFTAAGGSSLVKSGIGQILGTKPGELPWRPSFGTEAEKYRHRGLPDTSKHTMDESRAQQLGTDIAAALTQWDSRVDVQECTVIKSGSQISCRVSWTIKTALTGSSTLSGPYSVEVVL